MAGIAVGIDFGTSNTALALAPTDREGPAQVFAVDPEAEDPRLLRSVLFFPGESTDILAGAPAISRYLGEGGGRLLLSVKTFLSSPLFKVTEIRRSPWTLEKLVAQILRPVRERVEQACGVKVTRLVLGRPAVFSPDPEEDALASGRLVRAAELAGFPTPELIIEPFAAALEFEASLTRDTLVLVADFGAGTSDFTLMRLGPTRRDQRDRRADVLASSGLRVGGDCFDAAIVEHRLMPLFGHRSTFKSLTLRQPIPVWITRKLLAWHELSLLCERSTMTFLERVLKSSDAPEAVQNLITMAEENLGFHLYRAVEAAKRKLSFREDGHRRLPPERHRLRGEGDAQGVRRLDEAAAGAARRDGRIGCSPRPAASPPMRSS
ncbi:MAG: Hsp70 family protein [Myxococcales bacterium]